MYIRQLNRHQTIKLLCNFIVSWTLLKILFVERRLWTSQLWTRCRNVSHSLRRRSRFRGAFRRLVDRSAGAVGDKHRASRVSIWEDNFMPRLRLIDARSAAATALLDRNERTTGRRPGSGCPPVSTRRTTVSARNTEPDSPASFDLRHTRDLLRRPAIYLKQENVC